MLFSRIYNWIKYKTLPPSTLFLNRLFVERDSKHRRVTSNLGLTFRNSKWSNYARTNVNLESRTSYISFLFQLSLILAALIFLVNFNNLIDLRSFTRFWSTITWFLFDTDLYLKLVFSGTLLCAAQLTVDAIFSTLVRIIFGTDRYLTSENDDTGVVQIPRRLHKPLLYSLLVNTPNIPSYPELFQVNSHKAHYKDSAILLHTLYALIYRLRLSAQNYESLKECLDDIPYISQTPLCSEKSNIISLEYTVFGKSNHQTDKREEISEWCLSHIHSELNASAHIVNSPSGLFYKSDCSYSDLNRLVLSYPETSGFRFSPLNQLKIIQWNRWLYKYNLLHRSLLNATQALTFSKRLFNSGFYTSTLATRNLWASTALQKNKLNVSQFGELTRSLYGNLYEIGSIHIRGVAPLPHFLNSSSATSLRFYENTYHWFIQRFYLLSTLPSTRITLNDSMVNSHLRDIQISISGYATVTIGLPLSHSRRTSVSPVNLNLAYLDSTLFSKTSLDWLYDLSVTKSSKVFFFYSPYSRNGV